jgi:hypothetical protein
VQPHIVAFYRGTGRRGNRALLLRFAGTGARSIPHFFPGYGGVAARFRWRPNLTTTPGNCNRCPRRLEDVESVSSGRCVLPAPGNGRYRFFPRLWRFTLPVSVAPKSGHNTWEQHNAASQRECPASTGMHLICIYICTDIYMLSFLSCLNLDICICI